LSIISSFPGNSLEGDPMSPKPSRTFHYHACAHAFSGSFTRPFTANIDVQAPSALPIIGGHGSSRVENFQFREFVSFRKGYTHVSGGHQADDDSNNTLVTSTVEGLNLLDVVTADRIVARLYSKHAANETEGHITMVGTKFENLRIAGCPVEIKLNTGLFERLQTFEEAKNEFAKKGEFRKIAEDPFQTGETLNKIEPNGVILCSCVKEMETDCPGVKRAGHCFMVPGFGKVFLGEVLFKHAERTLTMVRLEIGSAVSGSGTAGGAKINGRPWP
jgi:hypothetical protein